MIINQVSHQLNFKGIYFAGEKSVDGAVSTFDDGQTKRLNEALNFVSSPNQDCLLIRKGQLSNLISVDRPALVLTNDKNGNHAKIFSLFETYYNARIAKLKEQDIENLEKQLSKEEIQGLKHQSPGEVKLNYNMSYKDLLIVKVQNKLSKNLLQKERNLYELFYKRAKGVTTKEIQKRGKTFFSILAGLKQ